jgi:hypothetical protein
MSSTNQTVFPPAAARLRLTPEELESIFISARPRPDGAVGSDGRSIGRPGPASVTDTRIRLGAEQIRTSKPLSVWRTLLVASSDTSSSTTSSTSGAYPGSFSSAN